MTGNVKRPIHNVFVYGTLKRGFPNHVSELANADYMGRVRTLTAYPLVIGGKWFSPNLIDEPDTGQRVFGELFRVGDEVLALLDRMEGTHILNGYRRITVVVEILTTGDTLDAWTYAKDRKLIDGIHSDPMEEYKLDPRYVVPSKRTSMF
jgi:gamma-glutamylaminecyclotransferase